MTEHIDISEKESSKENCQDSELVFETTGQIWRNALVISTGFLFLFTAFQSLQFLQSSLFIDEGLGTTGLAVIYSSLVVSALFVPSLMIATLGSKYTLAVSMACYIMYMAAHFYASWELFIPAAVLLGFAAAPLCTTYSYYLNAVARDYAKKKGITHQAAASLFFGVFFFFFQTSLIWGSIVSSQVLSPPDANSSVAPLPAEELALCGRAFCPQVRDSNNINLQRPSQNQLYMLAGIYTACACVAVIIILTLLQQLPTERDKSKCSCSKANCNPRVLTATFLQMKDYRQLLLIPISMYLGVEQAFFGADFTQAFITCPLGKWWVGYILICFGVVDACCALLFGKLVQFIGRAPFFILGAVINLSLVITFLNFTITQETLYVYFIFAGLWGMSDAVWLSQNNALYGVLFKENSDAAFANYRLWESLGYIIAFGYQSRLCFPVKAYILLGFLGLGMTGYGIVEYLEWRRSHNTDT